MKVNHILREGVCILKFSKKRLLPTGSIVLLKEGKKKLVIYGRQQILLSGEEPRMYDYLGCFFPEGYINQDYSFVFNHEDIEKILFIGFIDEEEKQFVEFLSK